MIRTKSNAALLSIALALLPTLGIGWGCSSRSTETATEAPATAEPAAAAAAAAAAAVVVAGEGPTEEQKEKMLAAKEALFQRLSGRLMEAMSSEGPVAAIGVCQTEAPQIAKAISEEQGVSIGRTGVRLRNQNNQPPAWATSLVEAKTDTPIFVKLSNDHAAALLPIKLQAQCLMCHGPRDQIIPDVQAQLAKLYPDDQATGFQEGELRGWFWVEAPL
jgi:hypothetical protein